MSRHARASGQLYLFDSLDSKTPSSSRKAHIRRLVDVLHLSIHRRDWPRAKRAWGILVQCPEFGWKKMWQFGLLLTDCMHVAAALNGDGSDARRIEYLRVMMLRSPENRVAILQEIILWLIKGNRYQDALDELELYLPSFPYQDSPVLHIYAGLLCLFLAHPSNPDHATSQNDHAESSTRTAPLKQAFVRESKSRLRRALELDSDHPVPSGFLLKLNSLNAEGQEIEEESEDHSDIDVNDSVNHLSSPKKRR